MNYLNSKPLIEGLTGFSRDIELTLDLPGRLADRMAAGELDVGLIPVAEYFRAGNYSFIPNIGIASNGPVLSVTLFSRVPWANIRRIALDVGSRSSAALTQVLARQRYGIRPALVPLPMEQEPESADADAVLLIGDRAMHACLPGFTYAYDLGEEWHEWTGLPFVFAVWAVRPGVDLRGVDVALRKAKQAGLAHIGEIAQREAKLLGLDAGYCRRYLQTVVRYDLGPKELAGLQRYYDCAAELDLAPPGKAVTMYRPPVLVA